MSTRTLTLRLSCDNAAFGEDGADARSETARILREAADAVESDAAPNETRPLRDHNGNRVGFMLLGTSDSDWAPW